MRTSAHLVSTMFRILSVPGALKGFSFAKCLVIWSLVMGLNLHAGFRYTKGSGDS